MVARGADLKNLSDQRRDRIFWHQNDEISIAHNIVNTTSFRPFGVV